MPSKLSTLGGADPRVASPVDSVFGGTATLAVAHASHPGGAAEHLSAGCAWGPAGWDEVACCELTKAIHAALQLRAPAAHVKMPREPDAPASVLECGPLAA
eukprot:CAMPEP_0180714054 /NCGR_PEP_ID=MMETSP1038_2-20121128/12224_1 /TAXON_ID=632150 /ORGANISM="Azadinium spinosum, Strain 3D9" /LENGTH=100 /DNA_ID=CAMNT_0022746407 /DNA_START=462 /DNA_END=761 /DNA_ORIENTATION=+